MPLSEENRGTNIDGKRSDDYCAYCYKDGFFIQHFTMTQMIEFCLQFLDQMNAHTGWNLTPVQAKEQMLQYFPRLKRWKEKDGRTLAEKATDLLAQCENVTVVSVDADGYPRPVQMSKIRAQGFSEVWMATDAASVKVRDFRLNAKAGLCYDHYGDGVSLRGTVEVVTDEALRREMWQDWFIHHFPGGQPTRPMFFSGSWGRKLPFGLTENFPTQPFDAYEIYCIRYSKHCRLRSLLRGMSQVFVRKMFRMQAE